ncbi:hypothetical protein [Roseateles sp. L2-2]|uniref:hypothetical protein n=1 Tax=Roseateles sp. L2-2 TaxID=3422597 RepID=UPI003D364AEF
MIPPIPPRTYQAATSADASSDAQAGYQDVTRTASDDGRADPRNYTTRLFAKPHTDARCAQSKAPQATPDPTFAKVGHPATQAQAEDETKEAAKEIQAKKAEELTQAQGEMVQIIKGLAAGFATANAKGLFGRHKDPSTYGSGAVSAKLARDLGSDDFGKCAERLYAAWAANHPREPKEAKEKFEANVQELAEGVVAGLNKGQRQVFARHLKKREAVKGALDEAEPLMASTASMLARTAVARGLLAVEV